MILTRGATMTDAHKLAGSIRFTAVTGRTAGDPAATGSPARKTLTVLPDVWWHTRASMEPGAPGRAIQHAKITLVFITEVLKVAAVTRPSGIGAKSAPATGKAAATTRILILIKHYYYQLSIKRAVKKRLSKAEML